MNLTWRGVRTVARQEFRLRLRAGRWRRLLAVWTIGLLAITGLLVFAAAALVGDSETAAGTPVPLGPTVFGFLLLILLSLALLVVPAISAQSVNGDRDRGTLATVQVTLLTPGEIVAGKFLAAWGTALVFVLLSVPSVGWAVALGGVGVLRALAVLAVLVLLLGVVAAISLALSAVVARTTMSAVLSYLTVFGLCIGTGIVFGLVSPLMQGTVTRTVPAYDAQGQEIPGETTSYDASVVHTERIWWLLAPNPYVVLADATPALPPLIDPRTGREIPSAGFEPLRFLGDATRYARAGAALNVTGPAPDPQDLPAVWPWGLAADVLLGAGALWLTARRLRTPARTLPHGSRVA